MAPPFQERLLSILDRKRHWAWPWFAEGRIPLQRLRVHFEQEWEVYVRDFPVLLARVLGRGPPAPVRRALAENLYEEQTGGLSRSAPHPDLFLRMMAGCGYEPIQFNHVRLLPESAAYRACLDRASNAEDWVTGAAVLTLFVEGSVNERQELAALQGPPPSDEERLRRAEEAVARHPLVRVHKVDPAALELTRVHQRVEAGHRRDAWAMVLGHAKTAAQEDELELALEGALRCWLGYRDAVAAACGVERPPGGAAPPPAAP